MDILFGPAGNSDSFYEEGYKRSHEMPAWLEARGLNAYEYSFGRGVRLKQETAETIGEQAKKHGITMSVHAPYYINFANMDDSMIEKSIGYLLSSAQAATWMGATRVIFHPGTTNQDLGREASVERIKETFGQAIKEVFAEYPDITLCPETMGKIVQIGNLEETIEFAQMHENIIPCIDFGHLHTRTLGKIEGKEEFGKVLDAMEAGLGKEKIKNFHVHFSRIEFTQAGERRHWTYDDTEYGPDFDPLAELLVERDLYPTIICESKGTMAEDAATFKKIYERTKAEAQK